MNNYPKYIKDLKSIKHSLLKEREEHFQKLKSSTPREWTDLEKLNQRYVDGIRSSFVELYEKHTKK